MQWLYCVTLETISPLTTLHYMVFRWQRQQRHSVLLLVSLGGGGLLGGTS